MDIGTEGLDGGGGGVRASQADDLMAGADAARG